MSRMSRRAVDGAGVSIAAAGAVGYGTWPRMQPCREATDLHRELSNGNPAMEELVRMAVLAANSAQMDDPAFIRELSDWLRFSPERAVATGDGLFSACSGNPVLPDWIGRRLFPMVFRTGAENDKYRAHVRSSAGIAVFTGAKADPAHWIRVGRSFERFALRATALGIRFGRGPALPMSLRRPVGAVLS